MKLPVVFVLTVAAMTAPQLAWGQAPSHGRQARRVGYPLSSPGVIQHGAIQHGAIQGGPLHGGACGCGAPVAAAGCCDPCCPPLIPKLLNGFDRMVRCLLPSCRIGCGGCGLCGPGKGFGGGCCEPAIHGGLDHGVIVAPKAAPATIKPTPAQQTYYQRRSATSRPRTAGRSSVQPTRIRRTAAPKPAAKPKAETKDRVAAAAPAKKLVHTAAFEQPLKKSAAPAAPASSRGRVHNPLRDN